MRQTRWNRLRDGVLLTAAEAAGFEVLITCDQDMRYQENFAGRKIAVMILSSGQWPRIRPAAARIASAIDFLQRGQIRRFDVDAK